MTAHSVGKWERGEGIGRSPKTRKAQKGAKFYESGKPNTRPYGVQCWCYVCSRNGRNPYHRWEDPCAGSQSADEVAA